MKPAFQMAFGIGLAMLAPAAALADLRTVMNERNLEKRSRLALENADEALKTAREAYDKGDLEQTAARVAEVRESVDLAKTSLDETGKDPRRSPKWFKRAEIALRDLIKKMDAFSRDMSVTDRGILEETTARMQEVHDSLLIGLMEGRRK